MKQWILSTLRGFVIVYSMATNLRPAASDMKPRVDPEFKPTCVKAVLSSKEVRPGGQISMTLRFRNDGTAPARRNYTVFVHVEYPSKSCDHIVLGADHEPTVPTGSWLPGRVVGDGPHALDIPQESPEGTYFLHVGVYSRSDEGMPRLSDQYVAEIEVSKTAAEVEARPPAMSAVEVSKRRAALARRVSDPLVLENAALKFAICRTTGTWALTDKATGETWRSNPECEGLAEIRFVKGGRVTACRADRISAARAGNKIVIKYTPKLEGRPPTVRITVELLNAGRGLRFSYEAAETEWRVESIRLLDRALWGTDTDKGYLVIPHRMGLLYPAGEGLPSIARYAAYRVYKGYSMAMLGAVKNGSAVLVHWDDPYAEIEVERLWCDVPVVPGHGMVSASLILSKSAKSFTIRPVGKGGYAEIARAYREVARERGLLRTWCDKLHADPRVEAMFGAANFKLGALLRSVHENERTHEREEISTIYGSFEEAERVAEHLKNDLRIDRAMVVLLGWIHRGYDNQHPDILPAAPECGGNEALAACAGRVKELGYLFGLHDNYADMYKDAPSWDESFIMKHRDGSLCLGGVWAGGQAYSTCSKKALELARREQNLPSVKKLFDPTIYFIDTTFAAPPLECFDPDHPLTFNADIHWKRKLCEYSRKMFGLFGSEEGLEWAIPCADYFEGMMSHKTQAGGSEIVIPLFEMVYGDCINLYVHQGDRLTPDRPKYVLDHILYAEMPLYHLDPGLYFLKGRGIVPVEPSVHSLKQLGPRKFEITYAWRVESAPKKDYRCVVHFAGDGSANPERIVFQEGHAFARGTTSWRPGETILDGPYSVEVPEGAEGHFDVLVCFLDGERRLSVIGVETEGVRYQIGRIRIGDGEIALGASPAHDIFHFERADGWTKSLCRTDRFVKNTYEVLSPLNRITAHTPMTRHEFLPPDGKVERTWFGDVRITVNYGEGSYSAESGVLPRCGFLVESPTFVAFHALEYGGRAFSGPTMVTARSLDGKPIAESGSVRLYRAFGDSRVTIAGREFEVETEAVAGR